MGVLIYLGNVALSVFEGIGGYEWFIENLMYRRQVSFNVSRTLSFFFFSKFILYTVFVT